MTSNCLRDFWAVVLRIYINNFHYGEGSLRNRKNNSAVVCKCLNHVRSKIFFPLFQIMSIIITSLSIYIAKYLRRDGFLMVTQLIMPVYLMIIISLFIFITAACGSFGYATKLKPFLISVSICFYVDNLCTS